MPRNTSSVVGSAQCKSSNASTNGCTLAPAITQFVSAANCRRRNSSGAKVDTRSLGSGISSSGASSEAFTPLRRHIGAAEALAAPFGNRVQRRVLQKLRAGPFAPGVRRLPQPHVKFLDQARLTQTRFADDQHQ